MGVCVCYWHEDQFSEFCRSQADTVYRQKECGQRHTLRCVHVLLLCIVITKKVNKTQHNSVLMLEWNGAQSVAH